MRRRFLERLGAVFVAVAVVLGAGAGAAWAAPGELDLSFGSGGKASVPLVVFAEAVQSDGKLLVAGQDMSAPGRVEPVVARLNANGSLDSSFGGSGILAFPDKAGMCDAPTDCYTGDPGPRFTAVAVQPDGKIVLGGVGAGVAAYGLVVRLMPSGALDGSFGQNGQRSFAPVPPAQPVFDPLAGLALQPDGKIVLAGSSSDQAPSPGTPEIWVARLNGDGSSDGSFGSNGSADTTLPGTRSSQASALALAPDGSVVVAGFANDGSGGEEDILARFTSSGSLDGTFGSQGIATLGGTLGGNGRVQCVAEFCYGFEAIALSPDGAITAPDSSGRVVRYTSGGALDPAFGHDGIVTLNQGLGSGVVVTPSGDVVVAGYGELSALTSSGGPDGSFGSQGYAGGPARNVTLLGFVAGPLVMQGDGKLLAAGAGTVWRVCGPTAPGAAACPATPPPPLPRPVSCVEPQVRGLRLRTALLRLQRAHCGVAVRRVRREHHPSGVVIGQSGRAGRRYSVGHIVRVTVNGT